MKGRLADLPPSARITDVEAALTAAGIPHRRDFDWHEGWTFEVNGQIVARGAAIGLLEAEVRQWLATISHRERRAPRRGL